MMQKKTIFFVGILLCLIIGGALGFYWYQKPRENVASIAPDFRVTAEALYQQFQQDENKATQQYSGKVLQVKGTVWGVEKTDSTLSLLLSANQPMGGINCSLVKEQNNAVPAKDQLVEVKGRCTGFLMDVNLVDAVVLNDNDK